MTPPIVTQTTLEELSGAPILVIDRTKLPHETPLVYAWQKSVRALTKPQIDRRIRAIQSQIHADGRFSDATRDDAECFATPISAMTLNWRKTSFANLAPSSMITPTDGSHMLPDWSGMLARAIIMPPSPQLTATNYWHHYLGVQAETKIAPSRDIPLLHELGHGVHLYSSTQGQYLFGTYSDELSADLYALRTSQKLGLATELDIKHQIASRAVAALVHHNCSRYWVAPACAAALGNAPLPRFTDVMWGYYELHNRIAYDSQRGRDSGVWRAIVCKKDRMVDPAHNEYNFLGALSGDRQECFRRLAKLVTEPDITNSLTQQIAHQALDAYALFCPNAAAHNLRHSGAPLYRAMRTQPVP